MIRVCVLPREVDSVLTRSKKAATAWFVDRHMQVMKKQRVESSLIKLVYCRNCWYWFMKSCQEERNQLLLISHKFQYLKEVSKMKHSCRPDLNS